MYVCYFEEIIRAVLKDPNFSLPYWNYSVPAGYPLPKEFRMQNDPLWGPLFRPNRNPTSNAGQPIFNAGGSASDLNPAPALAQTSYLPSGVVSGFQSGARLRVCMAPCTSWSATRRAWASIPWAANDPIFWMHHCNIDRIWTSWNNSGHVNPTTPAWLNKIFVFAGPDGKEVKAVVKDYTNTKKCDYKYDQSDQFAGSHRRSPRRPPRGQRSLRPMVAKTQGGPVALGAAPVRVNLQAAAAPAAPEPRRRLRR